VKWIPARRRLDRQATRFAAKLDRRLTRCNDRVAARSFYDIDSLKSARIPPAPRFAQPLARPDLGRAPQVEITQRSSSYWRSALGTRRAPNSEKIDRQDAGEVDRMRLMSPMHGECSFRLKKVFDAPRSRADDVANNVTSA
jgi:hypothetical protein